MVEIGESSFTYLQIFYSLDYGIPLPSYKIVCWVLALIFHIGCYIKDFKSTILNISQKMSSSDIYDLPKSLGTSLPPPPPIILPNPQVQGHSSPIGKARSRCDHILEMKSHINKPGELGVKVLRKLVGQSLSKSHSEFLGTPMK